MEFAIRMLEDKISDYKQQQEKIEDNLKNGYHRKQDIPQALQAIENCKLYIIDLQAAIEIFTCHHNRCGLDAYNV